MYVCVFLSSHPFARLFGSTLIRPIYLFPREYFPSLFLRSLALSISFSFFSSLSSNVGNGREAKKKRRKENATFLVKTADKYKLVDPISSNVVIALYMMTLYDDETTPNYIMHEMKPMNHVTMTHAYISIKKCYCPRRTELPDTFRDSKKMSRFTGTCKRNDTVLGKSYEI